MECGDTIKRIHRFIDHGWSVTDETKKVPYTNPRTNTQTTYWLHYYKVSKENKTFCICVNGARLKELE